MTRFYSSTTIPQILLASTVSGLLKNRGSLSNPERHEEKPREYRHPLGDDGCLEFRVEGLGFRV